MHDTSTRPSSHRDRSRTSRFGRRLLASCIGAALLPAMLVLLDLRGIGSQPLYWALTAIALGLLCTWPLTARRAGAGAGRTAALAVAILTVLLLGFLAGSAATTAAVRTWLPQASTATT